MPRSERAPSPRAASSPVRRDQLEDFLYEEAALLDDWHLAGWLELFSEDAHYLVPSPDQPDADPDDTLFLIADDRIRLESRVEQLLGKTAWAENPRSRTRRMLSNVRIREDDGQRVRVTSNFVVHRMRGEFHDTYVGHYEHTLVRHGDSFRIQERRAILDLESLRDVGKVSFIL